MVITVDAIKKEEIAPLMSLVWMCHSVEQEITISVSEKTNFMFVHKHTDHVILTTIVSGQNYARTAIELDESCTNTVMIKRMTEWFTTNVFKAVTRRHWS